MSICHCCTVTIPHHCHCVCHLSICLSVYLSVCVCLTPGGRALTSTERAVEVLAAMVGQSYVKDELVHGSYRSVSQSVSELLSD
jgi:hypothetical protein